jgi:hypothetical protein
MTKNHLIHLLELGHSVEYKHYNEYGDEHFIFTSCNEKYCHAKSGASIQMSVIDLKHGTFKIVTPAPKLLPVGTKVVVLENLRDFSLNNDCFTTNHIDMIGQSGCEIKDNDQTDYIVWNNDKSDWWRFPHWAVAPIEETEPHKYQEVIDLIEESNYCFVLNNAKEILLDRIKNLK